MKTLVRLGLFLLALPAAVAVETTADLASRLIILANSRQPESVALAPA